MTREEAIMVLKNEQPHCGKKALFPEEKKYEAYDVAIKALDQTDKIEESNFSTEQYKADLQSAYECGFQHGYADALNDECSSDNVIS